MINQENPRLAKRYPGLTKEQKIKFRELYKQGYSSTLIFNQLGQPERRSANTRMIRYVEQMGLPRRGIGFRCIRKQDSNKVTSEMMLERRKQRIEKVK